MANLKSPLARAGLAIGAIIIVGGAGALIVRFANSPQTAQVEQPRPAAQASEAPPTLIEKLPLPPPALDRGALIAAAAAAADAYAAGAPAPMANAALVGRAFLLRLPFGCAGSDTVATWTYNASRKTVKFAAQPALWSEMPWVRALAGDTVFEAAEGFWIPRPWTRAEACPPSSNEAGGDSTTTTQAPLTEQALPSEPTAERETLGLAQFFAPGAPRTRQRGMRPYEFTRKYDAAASPAAHSYQFVLGGRLAAFADGQPVHCWSENAQLRPRCLIAVELGRVAFEDPASGEVLAEWRD